MLPDAGGYPTKVDGPVEVFARELVKAEAGAKAREVVRCDHSSSGAVVEVHCSKLESYLQAEKDRIGSITAQDES